MADSLLDVLRTAATYGFPTLVDAAKLVERLLKPLELPQNVSHRPDCIDFSSCELIPSEHLGEFVALITCGDGNCCFRAASILIFGKEDLYNELRIRTVVELALHSFYYLADSGVIARMEAEMAILQGKATAG